MLKDLVLKNRSYRGYDSSRKVTREELLDMIDLVRFSAASMNKQALKFYPAWQEEEVNTIAAQIKWAAALPQLHLPYPGTEPTGYIVICHDNDVHPLPFQKDVGIAAQTILLKAVEMDLGGCMIGNFSPEKLRDALKLSENLVPQLVVAIGKPAEEIILTDVKEDGSINYYRDEDGKKHYVPKRSLEDILLN